MIGAMHDSLPAFRLLLAGQGQAAGQGAAGVVGSVCPYGNSERTYSYDEAKRLVHETFSEFAPELANLAERAFANNWIDVAPRPGEAWGRVLHGSAGGGRVTRADQL